ncbi:MAG TPA: hypothetical protein VN700_12385 [Vicinamibacterales bacterium]|nr:hypothetical protein [Vicinamibacterales bacterium]
MASFNDAFNELQTINANLAVLHTDNGQILAGQAAIKTAVDAGTAATASVKASVDAGTTVLNAVLQAQQLTNQILVHLSQQADTMICELEAIARNTCGIHNEVHVQTGLQKTISASAVELLDISKTVHPDAALDLSRREALKNATDLCCPPPVAPPVCHHRPCPAPQPLRDVRPDVKTHIG